MLPEASQSGGLAGVAVGAGAVVLASRKRTALRIPLQVWPTLAAILTRKDFGQKTVLAVTTKGQVTLPKGATPRRTHYGW